MDDVTPEQASMLRREERRFSPGWVVLIIAVVLIAVFLILGTLAGR